MSETVVHKIIKTNGSETFTVEDAVVREIPLTIYFNDEEIVTMLCSPIDLKDLALGFLLSEGFLFEQSDLLEITHDTKESIIWVKGKERPLQSKLMSRRFLSACCGKSRSSFYFANDAQLAKPIAAPLKIKLNQIYYYADYLKHHSPLFESTGGVHSGGLASENEVIYSAYDIGRHNVFDKIYGKAFQAGLDLSNHVLFFSGRVSSEILLKVAKMRVPLLIARSAPTDLALKLAEELNITVIGFARETKVNIYTCPERIIVE